jgi:hypothetical protein
MTMLLMAAIAVTGCQAAAPMPAKVIPLRTLNNSGVTGQATLTDLGNGRTRVEIVVNPANHLDMPSHFHAGTCANLVPQPKYPLENVTNGKSTTEIPVALAELMQQQVAVMTHKSNEEMRIYTSCGEIR